MPITAQTQPGVTAAGRITCGGGNVICGAGGDGATSTAGAALAMVVKAPLLQLLITTLSLSALVLQ